VITQLSRFVFTVAGALAGLAVAKFVDWSSQIGISEYFVIIIFLILGAAIGYLLGGMIGRELAIAYNAIEERLSELATTDLVLAAAGLLVGLLVALIISYPFRLVLKDTIWAFLVLLLLFGMCAYAGIRLALLKRGDFRAAFKRLNADPNAVVELTVKYLDTSAIIDGRFIGLRHAGLLEGVVRVPRFVLVELQTLADSADETKRARGKRGLDLLETAAGGRGGIEVFEADYPELPDVDSKLARLVRDAGGAIVTVDANLTKVARVQGLRVLNINETAAAMRPAFLPGDTLRLAVTKAGKEPEQGVGYLEDGTMVVIADGRGHVGREVETVVSSVLQTSVGRMVFAKVKTA
jgi:uncharacterized protein YacL